jgi:hypothetical protein
MRDASHPRLRRAIGSLILNYHNAIVMNRPETLGSVVRAAVGNDDDFAYLWSAEQPVHLG